MGAGGQGCKGIVRAKGGREDLLPAQATQSLPRGQRTHALQETAHER